MTKSMHRLGMMALGGITLLFTTIATQAALEEIVVVAQKWEQNLQDVPVAVTAISGAQLFELGVTDVFDLQQNTPGLIVDQNQTATTSNFSIRGVGTSAQNFGLESSVGLYVDGVYQSRQSSMINELVDVERVEVLRGPQGTLFGRNTPSGAVLLQTVAPSHEATGFVEATVGNNSLRSVSAAAGGSLAEDVLAFRVTGFKTERDGYVDAIGIGDNTINDRDRLGMRAQLLYTPNDDVSVRLIADYAEIDEVCCGVATVRNNFFAFNGVPGSDSLLTLLGVDVVPESRATDDVMAVNQLPISQNESSGVSAQIDWQTDAGTFTSITAFRSFDSLDVTDVDFSAAQLFNNRRAGESDVVTQEIRFTNNGDRFNYMVGGYYYNQDLDSTSSFELGRLFNPLLLANPDIGLIVGGLNGLSALTGGALPMVAVPFSPNSFSSDVFEQQHEAWAVFGQFDYQLTERLTLTAGLRYTDENKDVNGVFTQSAVGSAADFTAIGTNLMLASLGLAAPNPALYAPMYRPGWGHSAAPIIAPRPDVDATLEDDQLTGTLKLSWFANDNRMLYASFGTGYKSGGTNTDRILITQSQLFAAETSKAFEIGVKVDFPDQNLRLNAALHHTSFDDFQTNSFAGGGFNLSNAGEIEAKGVEVELYWAPTDDFFVNTGYAYNDAIFKTHVNANCWVSTPFHTGQPDPGASAGNGFCDRSGDRINPNPEHFVNLAATKTFPVGNTMSGYAHADYNYRSDANMDGNADPLKLQDGYGTFNASLGVILENSDIDIKLWARNLFDEDYFGTHFDAPQQDGKVNAYIREPRTYGITVRKNF